MSERKELAIRFADLCCKHGADPADISIVILTQRELSLIVDALEFASFAHYSIEGWPARPAS